MMKLVQFWREVRGSLWFVPGLCVFGGVTLAVVLVRADRSLELEWLDHWPLLFGAGAAGARSLLATVASSMITIVGVVFSITIVALSLAASQYTSRVLRNFMRDTGNQTALGAFVGIFAYCLVVLRTIRGEEDAFVSPLAVLVALVLGFIGIGVLIYFIHHISTSIQAAHILASASEETIATIKRLFPEEAEAEEEEQNFEPNESGKAWHSVAAKSTGYLQSIDIHKLVKLAAAGRTVIRVEYQVGQFVIAGSPLMSVLAAAPPDAKACKKLESSVAIGRQGTIEQDIGFGIRQIVDVALKALSPGVNDTTTAVMAVDYLTAIAGLLSERLIDTQHPDEEGEIRLLTRGPTYEGLISGSFDQIRQNAGGNVAVLKALLGALEAIGRRTTSSSRLRLLREHSLALAELCDSSVSAPRDRRLLMEQIDRTMAGRAASATADSRPPWSSRR
jgi:uncharacterized membrane protein